MDILHPIKGDFNTLKKEKCCHRVGIIKEEELVVATKGPSVAALRLRRNRDSPLKGSLLGIW